MGPHGMMRRAGCVVVTCCWAVAVVVIVYPTYTAAEMIKTPTTLSMFTRRLSALREENEVVAVKKQMSTLAAVSVKMMQDVEGVAVIKVAAETVCSIVRIRKRL
ncbi:hypothetical protein E2C01_055722 [Portunus trituberculatus]|uniref:Uncharacterized protein n=1 Tax=Portunus trituberculatus TaxID=210409 RepID=A0A5B7GXR0_PORTR|nr:hypothetical protein [Portunus trituberculatus]